MPQYTTLRNAIAAFVGTRAGWVAAHSVSDPTDVGTGEISSGTGQYARQACTWTTGTAGEIILTTPLPTLRIAGGNTVRSLAVWTAQTGGSCEGSGAVADAAYTQDGDYVVDSGTYLQDA